MKSLQQLIEGLCPNGVPYIKIADFATQLNGMTGVSNKWKEEGNCRFIDYMNVYKNISVDVNNLPFATVKSLDKQSVMQKGDILFTSASETPLECALSSNIERELPEGILLDDHLFAIRIKSDWKDKILPSFIKYLFRADPFRTVINKAVRGVTRFYISKIDFMNLEIPVPPIAVQEKIVEILDKFTTLTAELQAELQARQQQYEYYRNRLLSFGGSDNIHLDDADGISRAANGSADERNGEKYKWIKMKDIGIITRGKRFVRSDIMETGIPCFHYGDIYTYYGLRTNNTKGFLSEEKTSKMRFAKPNDVIIVGAGENKEDIGIGVAWLGKENAAVHDACFIFSSPLEPRYVAHYLRTKFYHKQIIPKVSEGKICSILGTDLGEALIPVRPMEEQIRIADKLDHFESLISDLASGLPAEIEARQKQYEYYRNKLLQFERLEA